MGEQEAFPVVTPSSQLSSDQNDPYAGMFRMAYSATLQPPLIFAMEDTGAGWRAGKPCLPHSHP